MTRVRVTYIAIDDEGVPIASAETQEHLKEALDIYYGVEKGAAKCEGWFPFQTEYPDDYEGYYEYSWRMVLRDVIEEDKDMVKVYCIEFYPHTVYDIKQAQTIRENGIPELSDEEISIGAINFCTKNIDTEVMHWSDIFEYACKWYREQLKQKQ